MSKIEYSTEQIKSSYRKKANGQKGKGVLFGFRKEGEENEQDHRCNDQRRMGQPIMQYPIEDAQKGARTFGVERVHQRLPFVVQYDEKDPWEAEQRDDTVEY